MTTQARAAPRGRLLEIRNLHVVFGDGQTADFRTVRCPAKSRAVAVDECLACAEGGGVAEGPRARSAYVSCGATAGEPARAATAGHAPVHTVMTGDVLAVGSDVSLEVLSDLLLERGIGGAPVVDSDGRPVGMVSKTDLLGERLLAGDTEEAMGPGLHASRGHYRVELGPGVHAEALPRATVGDAMTHASVTIAETAPVAQAAALLTMRGIHRLPVVSEDGRVTGLVTSSDVVRWLAEQSGFLPARGGGGAAAGARRRATTPGS